MGLKKLYISPLSTTCKKHCSFLLKLPLCLTFHIIWKRKKKKTSWMRVGHRGLNVNLAGFIVTNPGMEGSVRYALCDITNGWLLKVSCNAYKLSEKQKQREWILGVSLTGLRHKLGVENIDNMNFSWFELFKYWIEYLVTMPWWRIQLLLDSWHSIRENGSAEHDQ